MENVSKALLIAGGVLIAIIILSMFLTMYNRVSSIAKTQEDKKAIEQVQEFNAEYEAFDKSIMYGVDVITLYNKINNHNNEHSGKDIITLYLKNKVVNTIDMVDHTATVNYESDSPEVISNFDKSIFKCRKIEYNYNNQGKVNEIYIEVVKLAEN